MQVGIFAKTFARPTVEEVFDAVQAHNIQCVQFNLSSTGLPTMPDELPSSIVTRVAQAAHSRDIRVVALSGTYNMIHPDLEVQRAGLRRLNVLASTCKSLGTTTITLCTGTRNSSDMWEWHPDNASPEAWSNLLYAMEAALHIAEEADILLAIEPESANVVSNAVKGQALLRAMQSPCLKVIIDPANIVEPRGSLADQHRILDEAFDLLGDSIIMAHAKDRRADSTFCAAGEGVVDYPYYLSLLQKRTPTVPLIMHGLPETQVGKTLQFLRERLAR